MPKDFWKKARDRDIARRARREYLFGNGHGDWLHEHGSPPLVQLSGTTGRPSVRGRCTQSYSSLGKTTRHKNAGKNGLRLHTIAGTKFTRRLRGLARSQQKHNCDLRLVLNMGAAHKLLEYFRSSKNCALARSHLRRLGALHRDAITLLAEIEKSVQADRDADVIHRTRKEERRI